MTPVELRERIVTLRERAVARRDAGRASFDARMAAPGHSAEDLMQVVALSGNYQAAAAQIDILDRILLLVDEFDPPADLSSSSDPEPEP